MKYLKISIVIPAKNEEERLPSCLESIRSQSYPQKYLEIIVVNDGSSDRTPEIAKSFGAKVFDVDVGHGEKAKTVGFKKATGSYVMYLDADIELRGKHWFQKMILPFLENSDLVGSFTRYFSDKNSPAIERYLNFDPLQRDQIYQYFSPSIELVAVKKNKDYWLCKYESDKIPPAGLCLYKRDTIMPIISRYEMFLELDFLVLLVKKGLDSFAYVPDAGLYHRHVETFSELVRKRLYNLHKVYYAREDRLYAWFDTGSLSGVFKIMIWILYSNLFFPSLLTGVYKMIKYKDIAGLYEPFVNLLVTDAIVLSKLYDTIKPINYDHKTKQRSKISTKKNTGS